MDTKVQQFFIDLETRNVDKQNNVILFSSKRVKAKAPKDHSKYYVIDKIPCFAKSDDLPQILLSTATSKMYNEIGIHTPLTCPAKHDRDLDIFNLISQDVTTLTKLGYEVVKADKTELYNNHYFRNRFHNINSNWDILNNPRKLETLQSYMTEECFDQFVSLLLADELRTDNDRHWSNFFFYKKKGAEKFEGIIPIDLENIKYIFNTFNSKSAFNWFLKYRYYSSYTFEEYHTREHSYEKRIQLLQEAINTGKLKQPHINTIKKELEYDLPFEIKKLGKKYKLKKPAQGAYEMTARLWEYNKKTIGRDLEM